MRLLTIIEVVSSNYIYLNCGRLFFALSGAHLRYEKVLPGNTGVFERNLKEIFEDCRCESLWLCCCGGSCCFLLNKALEDLGYRRGVAVCFLEFLLLFPHRFFLNFMENLLFDEQCVVSLQLVLC